MCILAAFFKLFGLIKILFFFSAFVWFWDGLIVRGQSPGSFLGQRRTLVLRRKLILGLRRDLGKVRGRGDEIRGRVEMVSLEGTGDGEVVRNSGLVFWGL